MTRLRKIIPVLPLLLLVLIIGLGPFASALGDSIRHDTGGAKQFAGLENFRFILGDRAFSYSLNITVLWALANMVLALTIGFLLALKLVRGGSRKQALYPFLLIPWGIPVYIAIPLWRAFLHGNGGESVLTRLMGIRFNLMTDPLAGFMGSLLVSLWLAVPLSAFVFAGHMRKISRQVIEAARIDGASEGEIARHIYLPSIRESFLAMGILNFIKGFKEFTLVFMMTGGGPPLVSGITERHIVGATTTIGVFLYETFLQTGDWGINAAYAVIMGGLVLFITLVWVLVKRNRSLRPMLILTALSLLPGREPALLLFSLFYLSLSLAGKGKRGTLFPKKKLHLLGPAVSIHLVYAAHSVATRGFLGGFNPGVLLALLSLLLGIAEKNRNRIPQRIPEYRWGGLGFRRFLPGRGYTALSRISAGVFIGLTVVILYMLVWMSLSRISACYLDSLLPAYPTANNFRLIFSEERIFPYFVNTLIIAGTTALLLPLLIFPAAVRLNGAGRRRTLLILGAIQFIDIAGGMHTLIPLYAMFRRTGLLDTYVPLVAVYLYHAVPFSLFILTAYLEGLPGSYRDLARIEGMGGGSYCFRILLPLSLPPLITSMMTAFVAGWNGFQAPLIFLNDERLYPISLKLYGYVGNLGSGSPVWNLFAAVSVVNLLFIGLILFRLKGPMGYSPASESPES